MAVVTAQVGIALRASQVNSQDLGSLNWDYPTSWLIDLTHGSGLNQVNKVFQDSVTLAGSGAQSYDLDGGALLDPTNTAITFARIALIAIRRTDTPAASTQDENLLISGDFILTKYLIPGADTLSAVTIPIHPGGMFLWIAPNSTGVAITATTGDGLTITNASSADSCTFQIVIMGS